MFSKLKSILVDDNEMTHENQRFASLIFLSVAAIMSFQEYVHVRWLWDYRLTFTPGLLSSVLAVLMLAPLYLRGILKWNRSVYATISLILILMVFASFIELSFGGNERNQITTTAIAVALALSWLGMKEIAGGCWVIALLAGLYSTLSNNSAMGFYGYVYITSGFMGLLFHSKLNPGQLVHGVKTAYSPLANLKIAKATGRHD